MSTSKYKAQHFIDAIPGTGGIVSAIARKVGCDWNTAKSWIDKSPTVNRAWLNERETMLDLAESTVFKNIKDGDTQDAKWVLSRLGKSRGYADKQEVEHSGGLTVIMDWGDGSDND